MTRTFEKLVRLPMEVMISSMETMTRTMQDIQRRSEAAERDARSVDETGEATTTEPGDKSAEASRVPPMTSVPKLAIAPLFEMYKVPTSGFASGFKTISQTFQDIREGSAMPDRTVVEEQKAFDAEIVPLDDKEALLESSVALDACAGRLAGTALWQIGRPGRGDYTGPWTASFDYHVGEDLDPTNKPRIPHLLAVPDGPRSTGATARLNIHFSLDRDYEGGALALVYDRWGGEKDRVALDDALVTAVRGSGRGRLRRVALSLPALPKGEHVLTLTTSGETTDREHRVDTFKLVTNDESVRSESKRG